jgi:hypothetical protein
MGSVTATAGWQAGVLIDCGREERRGHGKAQGAQQKDGQEAAHGLIVAQRRPRSAMWFLCRMTALCATD